MKNNFVTLESQFVLYMSPTHQGTMHDKSIADQDELKFPDDIQLFQDTGYQGYCPENVHLVQPFKKPRNAELNQIQKWFNQYVAQIRISVEHAISGIKRCRFVKDKCRHFCQQTKDQIILIATGLHNFRVCSPMRKYKAHFKWHLNNLVE